MGSIDGSILSELQKLEEALLSNDVRKSTEQTGQLLTHDFQEIGSSGRIYSREQILQQLSTEEPVDLALEGFNAVLLSENIVLVTYRSVRRMRGDQVAIANRSSIWIFTDGRWRMRFHQGTPIRLDP